MNMHFLSFLLDVVSWLIAGFIYGKVISKFYSTRHKSSNIASIKMALAALLGGLIATAERALPSTGFSFYHFFIAMVYAFFYSLKYFGRFRRIALRRVNFVLKIVLANLFPGKVYIYK